MKPKNTPAPPLPSQMELATLAAALPTGTAGDRVTLAFEIWQAASQPWKLEHTFHKHKMDGSEARNNGLIAPAIPIPQALEHLFPELPPGLRLDRWEELLRWQNGGVAPTACPETVDITADLFAEIREFEAWSKKQPIVNRSKSASLGRYGKKWVTEAMNGGDSQTMEILISNTARKMKGDRDAAKERVQALIDAGLLVKTDGKLYGTPGSGKSRLIFTKSKPTNKK